MRYELRELSLSFSQASVNSWIYSAQYLKQIKDSRSRQAWKDKAQENSTAYFYPHSDVQIRRRRYALNGLMTVQPNDCLIMYRKGFERRNCQPTRREHGPLAGDAQIYDRSESSRILGTAVRICLLMELHLGGISLPQSLRR